MKKTTRRQFLGQASCAALGSTSLVNALLHLKGINALASGNLSYDPSYRALVCLMLSGGNDSFNMLVPMSNKEYSDYQKSRGNLAIPKTELLQISNNNTPGRTFGLHPSMPRCQSLFQNDKLTFVSNVGTLLEPTEKDPFYTGTANLPLGLLSHSDQSQQWQSSLADRRSTIGWGGRLADLVHDTNSVGEISMNISLAGTNVFQTGNETVEFVIDPERGSLGIEGYGANGMYDYFNRARGIALDSLIDHHYSDAFQQTYIDVIRKSRDGHRLFSSALEQAPPLQTAFSDNYISKSFEMVARIISAHETLGFRRQIFFIDFQGWDHHDEVLQSQTEMLGVADDALWEFYQAMTELGLTDQVTTFTMSEFGRSLTSNGNGSDHAWGGNALVMGGAVIGKRIFGQYPLLAPNGALNVYDGVIIPTTSADQYFAEFALWMGAAKSDLSYLFPNLERFYDPQSSNAPIGFLKM
ncbi:MAG: DUF1501 domain-containing protein [Saprospiraceae bacterium]|nr:DUF1501 domain-containing protein [Saprospiraceae bacterium]